MHESSLFISNPRTSTMTRKTDGSPKKSKEGRKEGFYEINDGKNLA